MKKKHIAGAACALALAPFANGAVASTVLGPGTVVGSTIAPLSANYTINSAMDQSGLSATYTSGVSDYDSYFSGNPTHVTAGLNTHFLSNSPAGGSIDLDLGSVVQLDGLALWNWHNSQGGVGTIEIDVFSSVDASFTSLTSLGSFGFGLAFTTAQLREFTAPVSTQYIRLGIAGNGNLVGFGELAFEQSADEVSAISVAPVSWLLGSGLLGLIGMARTRYQI